MTDFQNNTYSYRDKKHTYGTRQGYLSYPDEHMCQSHNAQTSDRLCVRNLFVDSFSFEYRTNSIVLKNQNTGRMGS